MDLNVVVADDGSESISRSDLYSYVKSSIKDYFEKSLEVIKITEDSITVVDNDGSPLELSVDDDLDPEVTIILYTVIAAKTCSAADVVFEITEDDEGFEISNIYVTELDEEVIGESDPEDADFSTSLSSKYLLNMMELDNLVVIKDATPVYGTTVDNDKLSSELGNLDDPAFESGNFTSVAELRQHAKKRQRYMKLLKVKRLKDPAAARRRSMAARLRWRSHRATILRGMKKFHMSSKGQRLHKLMAQDRAMSRAQKN